MNFYSINAFADRLFHGNPAGVCLLERELPEETMRQIAKENNLPETAFVLQNGKGYSLRWFTPAYEIDLCGHATLATAYVLMNEVGIAGDTVSFETKSGRVSVRREGETYYLDFPSRPPVPVPCPPGLPEALGCPVLETHASRDLVVLTDSQETVRTLCPNMEQLIKLNPSNTFAVVVTAKGEDCDFVSRYFAPAAGVPEDPVTGSSHSTLIPFWSRRLHKRTMAARQLSARGGALSCKDLGERVEIGGTAVCYLAGELRL